MLSKVLETSPLVNKVEVGWTLVSLNDFDVVDLDGYSVTKVLMSRADNPQRKLTFRRAPSDASSPVRSAASPRHWRRCRRVPRRTP